MRDRRLRRQARRDHRPGGDCHAVRPKGLRPDCGDRRPIPSGLGRRRDSAAHFGWREKRAQRPGVRLRRRAVEHRGGVRHAQHVQPDALRRHRVVDIPARATLRNQRSNRRARTDEHLLSKPCNWVEQRPGRSARFLPRRIDRNAATARRPLLRLQHGIGRTRRSDRQCGRE